MCYIPPLLSQFSFLGFSVQLERGCSLPRHAFPSSRLVFSRGIRNFLAITYSDNFRKTCHFFRHLGVSADQYNRGALLAAECKKCFSCFSHKECKTFLGKRPRKMMLETVLCSGNKPCFQIPNAQNG